MKKYFFEANKKQLEKPTEPLYVFCKPAEIAVCAEDEQAAQALAEQKLREKYHGTGFLLGQVRLVGSAELPVDWSYGYGDARKTGCIDDPAALVRDTIIR